MAERTPRAVKDAVKRAEEIHAEVYEEPDSKKVDASESPAEAPQSPAEPEPSQDTPQPLEPVQVAPAPPPAPSEPHGEDSVDFWRNKFRTLEGKYRAEVPRQASQLREQAVRIQQLEQTLAALQTAAPAGSNGKSLVTDEEIAEYGEDFVSMMRRLAQEEAGRAVQQVTPRVEQIAGQLQETNAQTQAERVYAMLDANVEDWRSINRSPAFLEWLDEEDPYVGETRSQLIREAFDRKDGPRVLTFFTGFLNQQRALQPALQPAPPDAQTPQARVQAKASLEQFVGPRSSGATTTPTVTDEKTQPWTRRQIAAFYKDVQLGVYKNNPEQRDRIERSINRASVEGLITP